MTSKPESTAGRAASELGQPEGDDAAMGAAARKAVEGGGGRQAPSADLPPAGPHADPALQNPDATPGTGALPSAEGQGDEVESSSG